MGGVSSMSFFLRLHSIARRRLLALALAATLLSAAGVCGAEIYKWKDQAGRLHFAQDLNQVPPRYRSQAKGEAIEEGGESVIQRYQPAPASPRSTRRGARSARAETEGEAEVYRIRVQRTGNSMKVNVRLNDRVTAPFYIDTGASDISLPASVAKELGLDLEGARTGYYGTANGTIEQSLVTLDSVELGGARVENVPAHVNTSMSTGLLGLAFFNHFRYRVDPVSGTVTLRPNGLVEAGAIRGGRSQGQWKGEFRRLAQRRSGIENALDAINPNKSRRKAELKGALGEVDRQLEMLEDEADDARVPMQWRD
jgi:clan AA aspartic protease (TIGR02281 family)